jgi:hypothetical protein
MRNWWPEKKALFSPQWIENVTGKVYAVMPHKLVSNPGSPGDNRAYCSGAASAEHWR